MTYAYKPTNSDTEKTYTLYGKLPNRADFVREHANHPVMIEFDNLIQRAFEMFTSESNWAHIYDSTPSVEFQYISRDARYTFMGVLAPSRDQAGRRYPLVAGSIVRSDSILGYAQVAPIANEVFFDGLRQHLQSAIENSVEALACRQFLDSTIRTSKTLDFDLAKNVVSRFLRITPATFLSGLLANNPPFTTLEQALLNIAFYRAFLHCFDRTTTNQIILLPLPNDEGERPLVTSTWLSILDSVWQGTDQHRRWNGNYLILQHPVSGDMLLATFLGKTPENFATLMLGQTLLASATLDLVHELAVWKSHRMYAEIAYALNRTLTVPGLSLMDLCLFLKDVVAKLDREN